MTDFWEGKLCCSMISNSNGSKPHHLPLISRGSPWVEMRCWCHTRPGSRTYRRGEEVRAANEAAGTGAAGPRISVW